MKVLICGVDGYLGWPLAQNLVQRGHEVIGVDNFSRRRWVDEMKSISITPIPIMSSRLEAFHGHYGYALAFIPLDVGNHTELRGVVKNFKPDCIVQMAEMPSAPYSMMDFEHAWYTHQNNLKNNLSILYAIKEEVPECRLVKVGTMGEYSYQGNIDIPEGNFGPEDTFRGISMDGMIFPRRAPSVYHMTKIQGTYQIDLACRFWGLGASDVMQGVVYGTRLSPDQPDELITRFDIDEAFGTAINRFCAQAVVGLPITPFGKGHQKRGFLPLKDSIQCFTILIENPTERGEYRVVNQFEEVYMISELAQKVKTIGEKLGLAPEVRHIENPRIEAEEHYYNPDHKKLLDLGYEPTKNMEQEIEDTMRDLIQYKSRIEKIKDSILPRIHWDGHKNLCEYLEEK